MVNILIAGVMFFGIFFAVMLAAILVFKAGHKQSAGRFKYLVDLQHEVGWTAVEQYLISEVRPLSDFPILGMEQATRFSPCVQKSFGESKCYLLGYQRVPVAVSSLDGKFLFACHIPGLRARNLYFARSHSVPFVVPPLEYSIDADTLNIESRNWKIFSDTDTAFSCHRDFQNLLSTANHFSHIGIYNDWCLVAGIRPKMDSDLLDFWRCGFRFFELVSKERIGDPIRLIEG